MSLPAHQQIAGAAGALFGAYAFSRWGRTGVVALLVGYGAGLASALLLERRRS